MKYTGIPSLQPNKPWFVMAAITQLEDELLEPGWRAFEWGAGYSTVWLSQWCGSVVSIEHDREFIVSVNAELAKHSIANVTLVHIALGDAYEGAIQHYAKDGLFDLIFIDGRRRANCVAAAVPHLRPGGVLVLDNSERTEYQAAIAAHLAGWQRWDHLSQGGGYAGWTTTIWVKP